MSFKFALFVVSLTPLFLGNFCKASPGCLKEEKLYRTGCKFCKEAIISGHYTECRNDSKWGHKICRQHFPVIKCVQVAECDIECIDMPICNEGGTVYPVRCERCLLPGQSRGVRTCGRNEDWIDSACPVDKPICCQRSDCIVRCIKSEPPSPRASCSYRAH